MLIAVNTRFLIKDKLEGIGWFTCETLKRITCNHPEHQFVFFFDRHFSDEFIFSDNITPLVLSPAARHPFLWYYWFEFAVSNALKKLKPDIFLSTDGYLCLRTKVKSVLVIHDLAFEHYPKHIDYLTQKYYQYFVPKYAKKADRIATVSRFSKEDIIDKYQISSDKIDVVYNGANELYQPLNEQEKLEIRSKYAGGKEYFIYVGALHPRKNIENLLLGFEQFKKANPCNVKLLLVGRKAWQMSAIHHTYQKMAFKEDVIFMEHLQLDVLPKLLAASLALVYVSATHTH